MAIYFGGLWLFVQDDTTLLLQVFVCPDVVVAREIMTLHSHICQLGNLAEEARKALRYHVAVFIPEVKHVAQQVDGGSLLLDAVEEAHQSAFLHALMWNSL